MKSVDQVQAALAPADRAMAVAFRSRLEAIVPVLDVRTVFMIWRGRLVLSMAV